MHSGSTMALSLTPDGATPISPWRKGWLIK